MISNPNLKELIDKEHFKIAVHLGPFPEEMYRFYEPVKIYTNDLPVACGKRVSSPEKASFWGLYNRAFIDALHGMEDEVLIDNGINPYKDRKGLEECSENTERWWKSGAVKRDPKGICILAIVSAFEKRRIETRYDFETKEIEIYPCSRVVLEAIGYRQRGKIELHSYTECIIMR